MQRKPLERMVRAALTQDGGTCPRIKTAAMDLIHQALEEHLVTVLEGCSMLCESKGKATATAADLEVVLALSSL